MKALSANKIVKILQRNDFELARQAGSHRIYKHRTSGRIVPVPFHKGSQPLKIGTFLNIVKQSGIERSEFKG